MIDHAKPNLTGHAPEEPTTLRDWIHEDARTEQEALLAKHGDKKVVSIHDGTEQAFPQTGNPWKTAYRNVMHWVILEDGSAVGWNESPRNGWSFPRTGAQTVKKRGY
ncbi:hypothetical protein [Neptuniibacter sp. QD37_11]|uniref:hypothetical protein n=1 Tax=Neptuniibacter sp. QD37_11 TaxID=3398209 RepID=UPI0039F54CE5